MRMNKKGVEFSLTLIIKIVLMLAIIGFAGVIVYNLQDYARKGSSLTEPPCVETGKTLAQTESILFAYFVNQKGDIEEAKRVCYSYKSCFPAHYSKYGKECEDLIKFKG